MKTRVFAATVSAFVGASAAQAQVAVSIWTNQPAASANATIAAAGGLGAPTATTTVGAINFDSNVGGYTIGGYLNNPVLPAAVASASANNTYYLFTGSTFLNAGTNTFTIPHDDGLELSFDQGIGIVLSQPGPTAPVNTLFSFIAPSAGMYNFTMSYGECCGPPARLAFTLNGAPVGGAVPEPATWAMMLLGFGGIGMAMRRRRARSLAQIA